MNERPDYGASMPEEIADRIAKRIADRISARQPCPLEPHDRGLRYDADRDVLVCPRCGHEQYEEMGG